MRFLTLLFLVAGFAACRKTDPPPVALPAAGGRIYVVCEGALGVGNAALSVLPVSGTGVVEDGYTAANNSAALGDVFQSVTRIGDRFFLCINNSDRITVVRAADLVRVGEIALPKPRYIVPVSSTKAYVSALFGSAVYVFNPQTLSVTDTIFLPHKNPEGMALHGGSVYVCAWDTSCRVLYAIDAATDAVRIAASLSGASPTAVAEDKTGALWVLSGNALKSVPSFLTRLDAATGEVLRTYAFPPAADPLRPVFNPGRDTLYFIGVDYTGGTAYNGVFRMGIADAALPVQPFVPAQPLQYFWGVGVAPDGTVWVADPLGFTQRGTVRAYNTAGALLREHKVGVGPGAFFFDQ